MPTLHINEIPQTKINGNAAPKNQPGVKMDSTCEPGIPGGEQKKQKLHGQDFLGL